MSVDDLPVEAGDKPPDLPPCPITGAPPIRCIERINATFLTTLWYAIGEVDVGRLLVPAEALRLWESPTGLAYFDPPIEGDPAFYRAFYERIAAHRKLAGPGSERKEFQLAATLIPDGARVLDVGCGHGGFHRYIPGAAAYTGLDPNFAAEDSTGAILDETVAAHAARVGPVYDVACAFQVIEHVRDPLAFARALAASVRPGGLVLIGTALWPSPNTTVPNFIINAPPHHLTWWTPGAMEALAGAIGCVPEAVHAIGADQHDSLIHWMARVTPVRCRDRFFRPNWRWIAAFGFAYVVGSILDRCLPRPKRGRANALLLVARKSA